MKDESKYGRDEDWKNQRFVERAKFSESVPSEGVVLSVEVESPALMQKLDERRSGWRDGFINSTPNP